VGESSGLLPFLLGLLIGQRGAHLNDWHHEAIIGLHCNANVDVFVLPDVLLRPGRVCCWDLLQGEGRCLQVTVKEFSAASHQYGQLINLFPLEQEGICGPENTLLA
jgi:hypothetical protein